MPGATFKLALAYVAFGVVETDGAMSITGPNPRLLNSAGGAFAETDVGKRIVVEGAGAAGADLNTFIARRISATQVELKDPALTTVTGSDVSYAIGVTRLSEIIEAGDVNGNHYVVPYARRLQIQVSPRSPGGTVFIGGPYVTPTNAGLELGAGESDNYTTGSAGLVVATADYLTSDTADQLVNIYWADDFNIHSPA